MARRLAWLAIALVIFSSLAHAQRSAPADVPTDRLIVKWRTGTAAHKQIRAAHDRRVAPVHLERLAQRAGARLAPFRAMSGEAQVIRLDGRRSRGEARAIAARLAQDPDVEYAVADEKRFAFASPNDSYFVGGTRGGQEQLFRINVPSAWDVTTGHPSLVVAVIDTGILPHPDLAGRTLAGHDFVSDAYLANDGGARDASAADPGDWVSWADVDDPASPFDSACLYGGVYDTYSSWHGTHMAGIIAANANNSIGIAGINWQSKILPVRVLGKCGGYDSDIIDGMRWAAGLPVPGVLQNANPARVLNLSLGGPGSCSAAWQSAISEVVAQNKVVVTAAGNEGIDFASVTPASCQGVVTVAAFTVQARGTFFESLGRSFYSNFAAGPAPNLFAAPGDYIYSTSDGGLRQPLNDGIYYYEYGTSGAAAHVSGIVSLMLSANASLSHAQVLQLLRDSAFDLGTWAGSGRIDALQAVGNAAAFHGSGPVPVGLTINGPAEVFEHVVGGHQYTATATWSDSAITQVYPRWSLTAAFAPQSAMTESGRAPEFSVDADQTATLHASFRMNGVTVTTDKTVLVKDNHVSSIAASGPPTVYLNSPSPAKFTATATWRDGRVIGGDVTWSVLSGAGSISPAGLFFPSGAGPVTVRASFGSLIADVPTMVISSAPPSAGAIPWSCTVEPVTGLTIDQINFLDVGASGDIIALCNGKVLVADGLARRVDLIDVVSGSILRSWNLASPAAPSARMNRMELATGSSKVFISFFGSGSGLASIDLADPDRAPQYIALPVEHGANYVGSLVNGDDGQVWVLHSAFDFFVAQIKLSRYRVSDGALLGTHDLPGNGQYMQYSRKHRILVVTLALSGGSRTSFDVSPIYAFALRETLSDGSGILTALSPDGTRLLLNGRDLDVTALTFNRGVWAGNNPDLARAGAGSFSPDGKRLAANDNSYNNDLAVYSAERHVVLRTYSKPDNCPYHGYVATRFSPTGAFLYGYQLCGPTHEYGRLWWVALGDRPTPEPVVFQAQTGVPPGALATSNEVTLGGFSGQAAIAISGGEYRVDGGPFTSTSATVSAGQTVVVRGSAPGAAYATSKVALTVGAVETEFLITTGAALPPQWWNASCASEADLGSTTVSFADIDPAWDILPMCDGRVLVGNRSLNRIELYDVRAGSAIKTWLLEAAPEALRRVAGTPTLLVITGSSRVASVNLDSDDVRYIGVGGRVFDVEPGEPGQMIAIKQLFPSNNTASPDTVTVHDIATGAVLATHFVPSLNPMQARYDPVAKLIYFNGNRLSKYSYTPGTHAIALLQSALDGTFTGPELSLSPDRLRIISPAPGGIPNVQDIDTASLSWTQRWMSGPFPRSADFRSDSAKVLIASESNLTAGPGGIQQFDVSTRVLERYWLLPLCESQIRKMRRVRFSPSGKYAYGLETCTGADPSAELNSRLFWLPTMAPSTMPQPNPAAFAARTAVTPNSEVTSNDIVVTGLRGLEVPISVTGGTFQVTRVSNDPFTPYLAFNNKVKDGDHVRVRNIAWFENGVTTTATLNIAGALIDFKVTTGVASDTMPDPFRLFTLKRRAVDTEYTSNTVAIGGIDTATPISISGGSYSVNGDAYTTAAGSVQNGDLVTVKMRSSTSTSVTMAAVLTVGGYSTSMIITTDSVDATPDAFAFAPRPRVPRSTWIESAPVTLTGLGGSAAISVAGGQYRIGSGPFTSLTDVVGNGAVVRLRVMSSTQLRETTVATLTVGPRSADFAVTTGGAVRRDLNADARSDVLWRNTTTGENYLYPLDGRTILAGEGYIRRVEDQSWQVAGTGDFDGDGRADILWRHAITGQNYIYLMNGAAIIGEGYIRTVPSASWQVSGVGDFDGDGKDDIFWRNTSTGENYLYPMDGLVIKPTEGYVRSVTDATWQVAGVGDFDGDGKADIFWRNTSSGQNYLYPMDGRTIKSTEGFTRSVAGDAWQVKGIGDFDGDGKSDVLWRNSSTGENYLYPMDGKAIQPSEGYLRAVTDLGWQIVAVGDYDGDGKSDILWRKPSTGDNYLYPMDGKAIKPTEGYLRNVPVGGWIVVGK